MPFNDTGCAFYIFHYQDDRVLCDSDLEHIAKGLTPNPNVVGSALGSKNGGIKDNKVLLGLNTKVPTTDLKNAICTRLGIPEGSPKVRVEYIDTDC